MNFKFLRPFFHSTKNRHYDVKYSFLLLTWNRVKFTELCVKSLLSVCSGLKESYEIIVADNGSTDGTLELLKGVKGITLFDIGKNNGLNTYKKLFESARGEYIIELDDDVIEFPEHFPEIFSKYMTTFTDYGALALDVVQDEHTNGAKPYTGYVDDERNGLVVQNGPCGGWCLCIRHDDYNGIRFLFKRTNLSMKHGEDGVLMKYMSDILGLKYGIVKDVKCLHANGPYYAELYGTKSREFEKYKKAGMTDFLGMYEN